MSRFGAWLKAPVRKKVASIIYRLRFFRTLVFRLGWANFATGYIAYHPDAYRNFLQHEEFATLLERFTKLNKLNNFGDIPRLWSFILNVKKVVDDGVQGHFAEVGVFKGNTASVMAFFGKKYGRRVYLFDTFGGFDEKDLVGIDSDKEVEFTETSVDIVKNVIGPDVDVCSFVPGYFPSTLTEEHMESKYSVVSLDCDLYEPTRAGLDFFYSRMPRGGVLLLHDYSSIHWAGSKLAIDEFCAETGELLILMPDKSGSAFIRKSAFAPMETP